MKLSEDNAPIRSVGFDSPYVEPVTNPIFNDTPTPIFIPPSSGGIEGLDTPVVQLPFSVEPANTPDVAQAANTTGVVGTDTTGQLSTKALQALVVKAAENTANAPITEKAKNWLNTGNNSWYAGGAVLVVVVVVLWLKFK